MTDDEQPMNTGVNRALVSIEVGSMVLHQREVYRINQVLDFNSVVGLSIESGRAKLLRVAELAPAPKEKIKGLYVDCDLEQIGADDWALAQERFAIISPLLNGRAQVKGVVEKRAKEAGVHVGTVYRWMSRYKEFGEVAALIPFKRGWAKGRSRISAEQEKVITAVINEYFLTDQRVTVKKAIDEVGRRCAELKIKVPNGSTVRARIRGLPDRVLTKGRGMKELADNRHTPRPGSNGADYPLQVVQIDHTPVNIMLVDDVHRRSIGWPWVTLAIDVYSRMVTGYYLSLDAPSAVSVAMCLVHSMLPKDNWLLLHGVDGSWPVWGKPVTLHSDNGPDFKAANLIRACANHNIQREFRPVKKPHWGGHIERLMGTFSVIANQERGTTFSSPAERAEYDSESRAIYSFEEFEARLVRNILMYNNTYHEGIYMAPIRKWNTAFLGTNDSGPLMGIPARPADPWAFQLDFLPTERRVIHNYGVEMDAMYYGDALRPWIGTVDRETGKRRKFLFRRDPRDMSRIWFYDESLKQYFEIPIVNAVFPGASVSEYVRAKRQAIKEGRDAEDIETINRMIRENREQEQASALKTKSARRNEQKRKNNAKKVTPATPIAVPPSIRETKPVPAALPPESQLLDLDDVEEYGGVW